MLSAEPIDFTTDWFVVDVVENLDANQDDRDRGHGATVILQRIDSGEIVEWRMPSVESRSPDRERQGALRAALTRRFTITYE